MKNTKKYTSGIRLTIKFQEVVGFFLQMTPQIKAYKEHFWLTLTICTSGNYRGHQRSTGHVI